MHHREFEPPLALRDTIKCFWYDRIDFGQEVPGFELVPDGYAEIIFHFGGTCSMSVNGTVQALPSPFVIGLLGHPLYFYSKTHVEIIGIRCFPWTVFNVLGLPSGKGGVQILDHPVAKLQNDLQALVSAGRINDAITLVSNYFLAADIQVAPNNVLYKAGTAMSDANGTLPVNQVASAAHTTVRTLERKFKESSGHTVKDVSGLMRFEQVRNHLMLNPEVSLAGLAHELGYTDQSHLSREFKRYSGTTPAAFARKGRYGR